MKDYIRLTSAYNINYFRHASKFFALCKAEQRLYTRFMVIVTEKTK